MHSMLWTPAGGALYPAGGAFTGGPPCLAGHEGGCTQAGSTMASGCAGRAAMPPWALVDMLQMMATMLMTTMMTTTITMMVVMLMMVGGMMMMIVGRCGQGRMGQGRGGGRLGREEKGENNI